MPGNGRSGFWPRPMLLKFSHMSSPVRRWEILTVPTLLDFCTTPSTVRVP